MDHRIYRGPCGCGPRHSPYERGAAIVEFALILPVLMLLLMGTIDFSRVMYTAMALTNAARAGVQYGSQSLGASGDLSGMQTAALNAASPDIGAVTATATRTCGCNGATPTVAACTQVCAGTLRVFCSVTTAKTFTTVMRYPGVASSLSLSRTAELRAQ